MDFDSLVLLLLHELNPLPEANALPEEFILSPLLAQFVHFDVVEDQGTEGLHEERVVLLEAESFDLLHLVNLRLVLGPSKVIERLSQ